MIQLTGEILPLYLMHKLAKHKGDADAYAQYLSIWGAARVRGLLDGFDPPASMKASILAAVEKFGLKQYTKGQIHIPSRPDRLYDGPAMLDELLTQTIGLANMVSYQAEADRNFPGAMEALENMRNRTVAGAIRRVARRLEGSC